MSISAETTRVPRNINSGKNRGWRKRRTDWTGRLRENIYYGGVSECDVVEDQSLGGTDEVVADTSEEGKGIGMEEGAEPLGRRFQEGEF